MNVHPETPDDRLAVLASLAEPGRRLLYSYVVSQAEPVSRQQAAEAVGVPRHVAKFHLDRLVAEGLLDTEYRRPPGRRGPGAGRPTKLYRRSGRELAISVPPRHYDLVGRLLASAVNETQRTGGSLAENLSQVARGAGSDLGSAARRRAGTDADRAIRLVAAAEVLREHGYEPRVDGGDLTLANCPFDALARDFTALVCGMNLDFVDGLLAGLDLPDVTARLDPVPGRCCVRLST
ncbi:MAG TPA: transcriptional regulator [Acidimicrobiia bacterium]|nr:transcriptional regulator [Acidimicrobiia bacterium]